MKQHSKLFVNLIFVLAVLAIAGVLFALRAAHATGSTLEAELIYGDANTVQKFSLDNDATYDVDTGYYTVHIEVKTGPPALWIRPARITSAKVSAGFRRKIRPPPACPPAPC